eukprot:gene5795-4145_t
MVPVTEMKCGGWEVVDTLSLLFLFLRYRVAFFFVLVMLSPPETAAFVTGSILFFREKMADRDVLDIPLPEVGSEEYLLPFSSAALQKLQPFTTEFVVDRPVGLALFTHLQRQVILEREAAAFAAYQKEHHVDPNHLPDEDSDDESEDESEEGNGDEDEDDRTQRQHQQNYARKKRHINLTEEDLQEDWYALLNIPQKDAATDAQIRAAYRQRCLETHPDKDPNHSDVLFKKVQRGFDILGDPDIRQNYDSSRPFDDTIPEEKDCRDLKSDEDFFKLFNDVFERNKKWSTDPSSLPPLGNSKTPYEKVMKFYDRWGAFRSWRDFSHLVDLQEITEDMGREEKRFYTRENERAVAQYRKEELQRIKTLVERAKKNDPRIKRRLAEEAAKRQKEKDEREAYRQRIRDEAEKKRLEAEKQEREKLEQEKREKEMVKQKALQDMQRLTQFFKDHRLLDDTAAKKLLPDAVRLINVKWLFSKIIQKPEKVDEVVSSILSASVKPQPLSDSTKEESYMNDASSPTTAATPSGFMQEVPCVLCFNKHLLDTEREIGMDRYGQPVKKVGGVSSPSAPSPVSSSTVAKPVKQWTEEDLSRLQKATAKYPPGSVERWSKIVIMLREKFTEEEAMAKVSELTAALHAGGAASVLTSGAPSSAVGGSSAPNSNKPPSVEDWTVLQQKQLENGLRELKDYKEKDKFQKIAKGVEGKTAKECFDRYKYLCALKKR